MLFNVLLSVLGNKLQCTLSRFADNIKLGRGVSILEGRAAIQEDIDRLEKWARTKLSQFYKGKHKNCTWAELTQHRTARLVLACRKGAGSPGKQHVSSVPSGNKGPSAHWAVTGRVKPRDQRKGLFSPWQSWDLVWNNVSSLGTLVQEKHLSLLESKRRPERCSRGWRKRQWSWETWLCWGMKSIGRNLAVVFSYLGNGCRGGWDWLFLKLQEDNR